MSIVWRFPVLLVFLPLLIVAAPLVAQDGELRPVAHEEVWLMKRLGSPEMSPDGRHAVVSVTEPSREEDGEVASVDRVVEPNAVVAVWGNGSGWCKSGFGI